MSKCIICGKEVDKTYGNSNLMGVYCRSCATENHYTKEQLIEYLQSQLEDKEKDYQQLKDKLHTAEQETLHFHNKYFAEKQIAIEELDKVKRLLNADYRLQETNYTNTMDYCECLNIINEYIDNQIAELTHQHENKGE